ncbi:MAG TPA: hypothetical protein VKF81_17500, partial [Blastocatellia bacterium]|nr:hypothetical protein [Blastocatellia bacterium]
MKAANYLRSTIAVLFLITLAASAAFGSKTDGKRKIEFTTGSKEAKECVAQIVNKIETFQFGPQVNDLA